ncbi:glycosyltransferase family 2 protein, partial [Vibrio jasicida]|uniref:glycosyltransferase family 2 protein n=1 Tax=Vibrio jasicida TaxID=766224 RepID=UPI000CE34A8E
MKKNKSIDNVLPIIVLYNPNKEALGNLLFSLERQVDIVCIVDNSDSSNEKIISELFSNIDIKVIYMPLYNNVGIAKAQNIGISEACKRRYEFVLLLDQDSELPSRMLETLVIEHFNLKRDGVSVGAIGPVFQDIKTKELCGAVLTKWFHIERPKVDTSTSRPIKTDYLIASGSLISLSTLSEVGLMREDLFIDWVDIEWGERANSKGYSSYIIPSVVMAHSIGDESVEVLGRE